MWDYYESIVVLFPFMRRTMFRVMLQRYVLTIAEQLPLDKFDFSYMILLREESFKYEYG